MGFVEFRELCCYAQIHGGVIVFYDKYLELCKKKGVKPSPAATEAGISKSLVTKWKTNKTETPSPEVLEQLSKYFHVPISELLGESEQKNNAPGEETLTEDEYALIQLFRKVPPERRAFVVATIRAAINNL
jgi:transcriptional regulator with XRE-family HTH domain